jgi:hypothetical protein
MYPQDCVMHESFRFRQNNNKHSLQTRYAFPTWQKTVSVEVRNFAQLLKVYFIMAPSFLNFPTRDIVISSIQIDQKIVRLYKLKKRLMKKVLILWKTVCFCLILVNCWCLLKISTTVKSKRININEFC